MMQYYPTNDASGISNIQELARNNAYEDAREIVEPLVGDEIEKRANENVSALLYTAEQGHHYTDDPQDFREYYVPVYMEAYPTYVKERQQEQHPPFAQKILDLAQVALTEGRQWGSGKNALSALERGLEQIVQAAQEELEKEKNP